MPATTVTVSGTLQSAPGVPARGNLQWQLSNTIFDSSGVIIGDTAPRTVGLDNTGHFSITVWANDDATTTPTGTYYTVTGLVDGQAFSQKYVISHTQAPSIDLTQLTPSSPSSTVFPVNAVQLQGRAVSATAPTDSQGLGWNAANSDWEPTSYVRVTAEPARTVSPAGKANGLSTITNNGADYGPDTSGTTTSGIQEAINNLPTTTVIDANNNPTTGHIGAVSLLSGVFAISTCIVIGPGCIKLIGSGGSEWFPSGGYSGSANGAGTTIYSTDNGRQAGGVIAVVDDVGGAPATNLVLSDMDLHLLSPANASLGFNSATCLSLPGWSTGKISNVTGAEITASGGVGQNTWKVIDCQPGALGGYRILENVQGFGGNEGVVIGCAGLTAINVGGAMQGSTITIARGIDISQNLHQKFINIYGGTSNYGLGVQFYTDRWTPLVIDGISFEAVNHYVLVDFASTNGCLILNNPCWDTNAGLNPSTDIATMLAAQSSTFSISAGTGVAILTRDEQDPHGIGSGRHVTVPKASVTAGASPYTYGPYPFAALLVVTTAGSASAVSLDGQSIGSSLAVNQLIPLAAGHTLQVTWATTAPVFMVIPA